MRRRATATAALLGFSKATEPSFEDRELIRAMAGYKGYGATKFKPVLKEIHDDGWPLAYQDTDFLYVRRKADVSWGKGHAVLGDTAHENRSQDRHFARALSFDRKALLISLLFAVRSRQ